MTDETLLAAASAEDTTEADATASAAADKAGDGKDVADPAKAGDASKGGDADDKTGGDAKDGAAKGDADKDKTGAPDAYEGFKLPDGMELDADRLEAFTPIAKELNLNQENAQKLVDFYADAVKAQTEAQVEAWANTQKEWKTATENDKEIGGQNLKENLLSAKAALKAFGDPAFAELVETYGLGNNPHVIRFLSKVGKSVTADGMPAGGSNPGSALSKAATIYDNPTSKPA